MSVFEIGHSLCSLEFLIKSLIFNCGMDCFGINHTFIRNRQIARSQRKEGIGQIIQKKTCDEKQHIGIDNI